MAKKTGKRLGRGLSSLVNSTITQLPDTPTIESNKSTPNQPSSQVSDTPLKDQPQVRMVAVDAIRTNPNQPRRTFDQEALRTLADSLRREGALQPVVLRPHDGGYELVAGERRYRASKIAGMREIPALIRAVSDDKLLELALVENVQRENLNPVEKARAYQQLNQKHGMSHEDIAQAMGEDRSTVANTIRLLALSNDCLDLLAAQKLTTGHAKALLSVTDSGIQGAFARKIVEEGWSVRRLEKEVSAQKNVATTDSHPGPTASRSIVNDIQDRLSTTLGTKVEVREKRKGHSGKIIVHYYNLESFNAITTQLGLAEEEI